MTNQRAAAKPEHVIAVRLGHGANCSSIGSVVDTLFLSAAVGSAVFAAVCAAMRDEPMRIRYEPFGAWVKLEHHAALVALDRDGVRALGLDGGAIWSSSARAEPSMPLEIHLAVTSRCAAGCEGCYLDARPNGVDPPRSEIEAALDALRDAGVFTVAFGGGEPTLRDDLSALANAARDRGITPVVTTSGLGVSERKIEHLKAFAQVNVSYDAAGETYAKVRGFGGAAAAESMISKLVARGVNVGVNIVLTRTSFEHLRETIERATTLGASEVQLLRYKPQGRARSLSYFAERLSPEQACSLGSLLRELTDKYAKHAEHAKDNGRVRFRIDCALLPFLSADAYWLDHAEMLVRWGVFGCEAGRALGATCIDGRIAPCSFAPPTNLHVRDLRRGWPSDPDLRRFRDLQLQAECASCMLLRVCRGGCKIVTEFITGSFGADPECPRLSDRANEIPR
ncbi:MAG: radical SAM protein [Polyangiaceae bacterium]|nr:radical SAM protein [Polyangiaceae bacterium]